MPLTNFRFWLRISILNNQFRISSFVKMVPQTSILWRVCSPADLLLILVTVIIFTSGHASAANYLRNQTDRLALLEFKSQIKNDPKGVLNLWNDSRHHCEWQGVTCDTRHQRVTALNLLGKGLLGTLSPHIGNLSFLKFIQLGENNFYGKIPQEISYLFRLRTLNLTENALSGEIPANLSRCSELKFLDLNWNILEGKIPIELGSLKKLLILYLAANSLTGAIPPSLVNLSSIQAFSVSDNHLDGILPVEMGSLTSLSFLGISLNNFIGKFPTSIYNISMLSVFSISGNNFYGQLPANLGESLPNLKIYYSGGNKFSGNIPISLANASELKVIDVSANNLQGHVPNDFGGLPNLRKLNVESNLLGANSTGDLSFIASLLNCSRLKVLAFGNNRFGGELPNYVANLSSQLTILLMGNNNIGGTIPAGLGSLTNLIGLGLDWNSFSGPIPSDFGQFQNLQGRYLGPNRLSGQLPSSFCNLTSLYKLVLLDNKFEGNVPACLGKFRQLKELYLQGNNFSGIIPPEIFDSKFSPVNLDLSYNSLSGSLALQIGKLVNINNLSLAFNKFSGEIPITLGDCKGLEFLAMQGNFFNGEIPQELTFLKNMQVLDLSWNNLTGKIPRDLGKLSSLTYLSLSFNDLEGEVPTEGVFGNASRIMLEGNSKICGGIPKLKLPPCPVHQNKKRRPRLAVVLMSTIFPVILIFGTLIISFYIAYRKRCEKKVSLNEPWRVNQIIRISYNDLHRATTGFSPEKLIGSGSFGSVYQGRLDRHGDKLVAIKVLDLQKTGASKSFKAECRVLRNIRHRNLVSLLTYCSSIDFKGLEFKALVYEFMENGSLDMWLHPGINQTRISRNLNLFQRLNIAIGVASALHYLHNQYDEAVVIHCDLKPSNILLDNNFTAYVAMWVTLN